MKYVRETIPNRITIWRKRALAISTASAKMYAPEEEQWIGLGLELSESAFHQISPTRAWWIPQGTR